jgi:hypothetical protein
VHELLWNAPDVDARPSKTPLGSLRCGVDIIEHSHTRAQCCCLLRARETTRASANDDHIVVVAVGFKVGSLGLRAAQPETPSRKLLSATLADISSAAPTGFFINTVTIIHRLDCSRRCLLNTRNNAPAAPQLKDLGSPNRGERLRAAPRLLQRRQACQRNQRGKYALKTRRRPSRGGCTAAAALHVQRFSGEPMRSPPTCRPRLTLCTVTSQTFHSKRGVVA